MPKPPKDIKAFKHTAAKRAHIPSAEEAGSEAASPAVKGAPAKVEIPPTPSSTAARTPNSSGSANTATNRPSKILNRPSTCARSTATSTSP